MELTYETIQGIPVVTRRDIYQPLPEGGYPDAPQLVQKLTDVKFDNGFTMADMKA